MTTPDARVAFTSHTDERLLDLLLSEGDRLPREVVDEFIRRGETMVAPLTAILKHDEAWEEGGDLFWRPIHATFILGAIGGEAAIEGLVAAVRSSNDYEVDWLWTPLPRIFGLIGPAAVEPLRVLFQEADELDGSRTTAAECLAAIAALHESVRDPILNLLRAAIIDEDDDEHVRAVAANALLDFVLPRDEEMLKRFVRRFDDTSIPLLNTESVEHAYRSERRFIARYEEDWLTFYDPAQIAERQERWAKEANHADDSEAGASTPYDDEDEQPPEHGAELFEPNPPPLTSAKVGRNAPCPCGSGKKYKKCCLERG